MGGWRVLGRVAFAAALLCVTSAAAATTVEPIARLSLEGGYDSNALYDGNSADEVSRITPEVGLRARDRTFTFAGTYGGEWLRYARLAPDGVWNQRGSLALDARLDRRTQLDGDLRMWETFDPAALAQAGVFRSGVQRALLVNGNGRVEWRADRLDSAAFTYLERTVVFQDRTGGAMHAPGFEVLHRLDERLWLGAAYSYGVFQTFQPGPDDRATSHGLRLRARWRAEHHVMVEAWAGPALWLPEGASAVVPEGYLAVFLATRGLDLRANVGHTIGIGATAEPGLVDTAELGFERRIGRTWFVRGDGGLWHSGAVPTGAGAVTGYAGSVEGGVILTGGLRLSLRGAHYGRTDSALPMYERTTVAMRIAWELGTH
jgi:hypothetical protein